MDDRELAGRLEEIKELALYIAQKLEKEEPIKNKTPKTPSKEKPEDSPASSLKIQPRE